MTLLIAGTVGLGMLLGGAGVAWMVMSPGARWRGGALVVVAMLLQSWWVVLAALTFIKFFVLKQDT